MGKCELRDVIYSFALTEIKLYFSSLSTLGSLTLKYRTDIEVEVSEMREECLCRASLSATLVSLRKNYGNGQEKKR